MSHIALRAPASRLNWLIAAFDWLRQAKVAASLPQDDIEDLSDRQLRDVGATRKTSPAPWTANSAGWACSTSAGR